MAQGKDAGLSSYQFVERSHRDNLGVESLPMKGLVDMVLADVEKDLHWRVTEDEKGVSNVSRDTAHWSLGPNGAKGALSGHL